MMTEQQIRKSAASHVLQLNANDSFVHYCYTICLLLIILIFTPWYYFNNNQVFTTLTPWVFLICGIALAGVLYGWKRKKLAMQVVPVSLTPEETERVVKQTINEIGGIVCAQGKNYIVAKTPTPLGIGSGWGSKIFVLLDDKQVLIKSISGVLPGGGTPFFHQELTNNINKLTNARDEA